MPKLAPDIEAALREACASALNAAADNLAAQSLLEAPLETGELRGSARYPGNDDTGAHKATAESLTAFVSYDTVYAAAQHEGSMIYHQDGHEVVWVVRQYTTLGTKSHYLEDPMKAAIPRYERTIGLAVERRLGELLAARHRA